VAQNIAASSGVLIPAYRRTAAVHHGETSWSQDGLLRRLRGRQSHSSSEPLITLEITRCTRLAVRADSGTAIISDSNYTSLFQDRFRGWSRINIATIVQVIFAIFAEQCDGHTVRNYCYWHRGVLVHGRLYSWFGRTLDQMVDGFLSFSNNHHGW